LGSGDDLVITDDENITLNLLRNALGGPANHLQLQSFHYMPGLHAQQQQQKQQQQEWTCRQQELGNFLHEASAALHKSRPSLIQ
jgi:hypothetical protein